MAEDGIALLETVRKAITDGDALVAATGGLAVETAALREQGEPPTPARRERSFAYHRAVRALQSSVSSSRPPVVGRAEVALRGAIWLAVFAAVAYFIGRGVARALVNSGDLAVGYSAGRVWLAGHDPYDVGTLAAELTRAGSGELAAGGLLDTLRNVYFPTTLPIFAPLGVVSFLDARLLVLVLNIAATVFIALGVGSLLGWRPTSMKGLALTALILSLAPYHTTMAFGQTGILAAAAVVAAILAERQRHPHLAGFAYGIAAVIKIQIGLPFLLYLLWRRRWAMPLTAALVIAGATAVSVIRMELASVGWSATWLANLNALSGPGGLNDPGVLNVNRFTLLDLQYPLRTVIDNGPLVLAITLALVGSAALAFMFARRGFDPSPDLLALALVTSLGLLVAYHRYYDAVLLAVPIAWACSVLGTARCSLPRGW